MSALYASVVNHLISLVIGVGVILYGFGIVGGTLTDPKKPQFRKICRFLGPIIILVALAQIIFDLFGP